MVLSTLLDIFCLAIPVRDPDIPEQFYADLSARSAAPAGEYRTFALPGNLLESGYYGDPWMTP